MHIFNTSISQNLLKEVVKIVTCEHRSKYTDLHLCKIYNLEKIAIIQNSTEEIGFKYYGTKIAYMTLAKHKMFQKTSYKE